MRLLYPCDPFEKNKPDEAYGEEFCAFQAVGILCSLYSAEDFDLGEFKARPSFEEGEEIIYRGWMLTPENYARLCLAVEAQGGRMLTSPSQYQYCHHLPEWYPVCTDVTPETLFLDKGANFAEILAEQDWQAFFVKDYVKSLTTSRGSVARTVEEVTEIVALIEKFRGQIEGGVCIREFEDLLPETEERYFVFRQKAYGRDGEVPEIVEQIAARIASPFFSIDMVRNATGALRLMELGDGQVSDRKKWPASSFVEIFGH